MNGKDDPTHFGADRDAPFEPLEATTEVVYERGRWVVMLNVMSWKPSGGENPIVNNWKRINDYATQQEATVAGSWIARSVNRNVRPPTGF